MFSGCGGLDLGFERAGFNIPVANEFDKTIWATFKANHPNTHLIEGDIRQVTKEDIEQFINENNLATSDSDCQKANILSDVYNMFMTQIKRPEFSLEQEVRFIYRQDYGGNKTDLLPVDDSCIFYLDKFLDEVGLDHTSQIGNPQKVKFACFGNRIRKYYEFSFKPFGINNVIKSIILGPKARQDICELKEYLTAREVTAEVKKSEIELRD